MVPVMGFFKYGALCLYLINKGLFFHILHLFVNYYSHVGVILE